MVSRRGALGGAVAAAASLLSGCGIRHERLVRATTEAAASVDGVSGVELELNDGANFERLLSGTVSLEAEDRSTGLTVFDEVMREIVTVIHDELGDPEARSLRVGWITGVLPGGEEITPFELEPDITTANPRRDRITAGAFYGRYGLD